MITAKESALQKELSRLRTKTRILENLIQNGCDLRDCPFSVSSISGWAAPEIKYSIAASFRAIGGGEKFVLYGNDISKLVESADFYSREKYKLPTQLIKIEDQSHVGRMIDRDGTVGEVVGIYPYSESRKDTIYIVSHAKGHWILGEELDEMKDFDYLEVDCNLLSNAN